MTLRLLILIAPIAAWAQPLSVYSDLARIDKSGNATAPETPREILSPMMIRNGFTSFQVTVQAPPGKHWELHVGQNPDNAAVVTMYRESGDTLERVELPVGADGTQIFWMDVWIAKDAPVRRIKVEPELNIDDDWVIYPMEGRVTEAAVQGEKPIEPTLPARGSLRFSLCYTGPVNQPSSGPSYTLPAMRDRNERQDAILTRVYGAGEDIKNNFKVCDGAPPEDQRWYVPRDYEQGNPEGYLKVRDYLFRLR